MLGTLSTQDKFATDYAMDVASRRYLPYTPVRTDFSMRRVDRLFAELNLSGTVRNSLFATHSTETPRVEIKVINAIDRGNQ